MLVVGVGGGGGVEPDVAGAAVVEALLACVGAGAGVGAVGFVCSASNARIRVKRVALLPLLSYRQHMESCE